MAIIYWNCRGYRSKFEEVKVLINYHKSPACIFLQETYHGISIPHPPKGYTIECADPVVPYNPGVRPARGVITLISTAYAYYKIKVTTDLEAVAIRINIGKPTTLCNIYVTPDEQITGQQINNLIAQLPRPFILAGDFNARSPTWGDTNENEHGRIIEDILSTTDVCVLNTGAHTHLDKRTGTTSAIDLALASPGVAAEIDWCVEPDTLGSDHFPCSIKFNNAFTGVLNTSPRFKLSEANWSLYKVLTYIDERIYQNIEDIDEVVDKFYNLVNTAADASIPTTMGHKYNPIPWWNEECKKTHKVRKYWVRKYRNTKTVQDKIELNRASAIARRTKRQARKQSWREYVASINCNTPMATVWKKLRKMTGKYSAGRLPCIKVGGNIEMDSNKVADALAGNMAFISSTQYYEPNFQNIKTVRESRDLQFTNKEHQAYNEPIRVSEIYAALKSSKNTAPGEDRVHYMMIKNISDTAMNFLLHIFNKVWLEYSFPQLWKKALVIPFLKPNKDPTSMDSYRPIALTSCLCKILEKIVNLRLIYYLEKYNFLVEHQYGFRKMRSTTDALAKIQTDILNTFTNNKHLIAVFFDIEKAFDTTWRYKILKTIHDIGIKGALAFFIKNFLSNRVFQIKIGESKSKEHIQEQGVPQGSVLSVTLFTIAINDIADNIPQNVCKSLYADDLVIYYAGTNVNHIQRNLQLAINNTNSWAKTNGYRLSNDNSYSTLS